jgi:hypothetical protein
VESIGAAGTFVVRAPGHRQRFLTELRRRLPFSAVIATCDSRDLARLKQENPFERERPRADLIQFVSVLSRAGRRHVPRPAVIPPEGRWFVRILGSRRRLVYGVYRRHMKTIGYLGRLDDLFGAPATTRSWSTMLAVVRAASLTVSSIRE